MGRGVGRRGRGGEVEGGDRGRGREGVVAGRVGEAGEGVVVEAEGAGGRRGREGERKGTATGVRHRR